MSGRPDIALGICPNDISSRAVQAPACATAAGALRPSAPAASSFTAPSQENGELATAADKVSRSAVVVLSEASLFVLTLIARHDGVTPQAVLTRLIAERGRAIGLSPLLGEHFDDVGFGARETIVMRHHDIRTGTVTREGDLADVPAFERAPGNRFRSGGP